MKILITGSSGFIGSKCVEYFEANNYQVFIADKAEGLDLCNWDQVRDLPDVDIVLHLAAINGTKLFYQIPYEIHVNNTIPTFNLLKRYKDDNIKFVFASTCEIFNSTINSGHYSVPTDESVPVMFEDIQNPRWSYSLPKALGENLVANSGLEWLVLRYFNIFGPGQKDHFINEFVDRCIDNSEAILFGNDTRSFCFINDAVSMTEIAISSINNKIVNIGNNEERKISDVAHDIMKILELDTNDLKILPGKKGSAARRAPDISLFKSIAPQYMHTDYNEALELTIKSILSDKKEKE